MTLEEVAVWVPDSYGANNIIYVIIGGPGKHLGM